MRNKIEFNQLEFEEKFRKPVEKMISHGGKCISHGNINIIDCKDCPFSLSYRIGGCYIHRSFPAKALAVNYLSFKLGYCKMYILKLDKLKKDE